MGILYCLKCKCSYKLFCLQMVAAEAKESISLTNKKSSSLLKYSIQFILFLLRYVCLQNIPASFLPLYRMRLSFNMTSTASKYSVAPVAAGTMWVVSSQLPWFHFNSLCSPYLISRMTLFYMKSEPEFSFLALSYNI